MNKFILFIIVFILALITCNSAVAVDTNHTYTLDEDFDNGTLVGLEHNTTHDQLQLSNNTTNSSGIVQPFIWIPNSNEGTVSKVDSITGRELARYRTSPYSYANPSRTTVDLQGNCWVGNRQTGTAVKIGLYENGGYIDRNGNGIIETSRDLNNDGVITGNEILPWGQDECVLWEVILIPGSEGTYAPGEYHGSYVNDNNNPGPRGIAVDSKNNVWIGTYGSMKYYYVSGQTGQILKSVDLSSLGHTPYGAVIDQNGILWSASAHGDHILRLDTTNDTITRIDLGHCTYGLGLDRNNHLFVSGWDDSCFSRINIITGEVEWTNPAPWCSRGVAVTDNGDVWIANSADGTVTRYSNDGELKATIIVGNTPTGVSIDNQGKIWVVDYGDEYIHRIDPATNTIDVSKQIPGGFHYGYSDMTGLIANTITTRKGIWTIIHDSELQNAPWGIISWNSSEPQGTSIKVRVRSSNDKQNWSDWEDTNNGSQLSLTPPGRYLQIETTLQILSGNVSPVLYDLTVKAPVVDIALTSSSNNPTPHPGDIVQFTLEAKNNGPTDARGVKVNYRLPSGFEFISSPSSYNPSTHIWNIGDLIKGASTSLILQARSISPGTFISSAWASSQGYDLNMINNFALLSVRAMAAPVPPYQPPTPSNGTPGTVVTPINVNSGGLMVAGAYKTSAIQSRQHNTVPMQETGVPLNLSGLAVLLILFGNLARRKGIINNKFFWLFIAVCFIFITCGTVSAVDNTTNLVSMPQDGGNANGYSDEPSISADGRYVAFSSYADNMVPGDNDYYRDVFVRDLWQNTTKRVSISTNGDGGNGDSFQPAISADGRYIAFASYANNLVEGDTSYYSNIFVHDMNSGTTVRISNSVTSEEVDGDSFAPSISADGYYVAFVSYAHNLVNDGSTSEYYGTNIFVHNMISGTTENITALDASEGMYNYYGQPSISGDGRYIAFTSGTSSSGGQNDAVSIDSMLGESSGYNNDFQALADDPLPNYGKVLVYDRITGITENISVSNTGEDANGDCFDPSISADGLYVAFASYANNLVSGDNNEVSDIFVYDRTSGNVERMSISTTGEENNEDSYKPSISADGRYVAFTSGRSYSPPACLVAQSKNINLESQGMTSDVSALSFTNLFPEDNNDFADVFLRDRLLGTTQRISLSITGSEADEGSGEPSISADGRYVAFTSRASNLTIDPNNWSQVYIRGPVGVLSGISAVITPVRVKTGTQITINAMATPGVNSITVTISGQDYTMTSNGDGTWTLLYNVIQTAEGQYPVLIQGRNADGQVIESTIYFTIDNTPPHVDGQLIPNRLAFMGTLPYKRATISAIADADTESITADVFGDIIDLHKNSDGTWSAPYTFWRMDDGTYSLILTATDQAGNTATKLVYFTADNSPPTLSGNVTPEVVRSGDSIIITVNPDPAAEFIRFSIFGETIYSYTSNSINYTVPQVPSGIYPISIMARYGIGTSWWGYNYFIEQYIQLDLNVDNTPPTVSGSVTPYVTRQGDVVTVSVSSDPDTASVTARILGVDYPLSQQPDGTWKLDYTVPQVSDGNYDVELTAVDKLGHEGTGICSFTVDSTLPVLTANLSPDLVKSGETITVRAYTNPDAQSVVLWAPYGWGYGMVRQGDNSWLLNYGVPGLSDGVYTLTLIATNSLGHQVTTYLNFTVDNPPALNSNLNPSIVKSGDSISITATSDPDTANITAMILDVNYNLVKQEDGSWSLNYIIPQLEDGVYPVLLTATDQRGNQASNSLSFTVQTIPPIFATVTPKTVKSGQSIHINANTDPDVISFTAGIMGNTYNLVKQSDGTWSMDYTVPNVSDGPYVVILNARDKVGNQAKTKFLVFNVDSTPTITATLTPNLVKSGDTLQINASTDTEVENITARIFGDTLNLIKQADGTWGLNYTVPQVFDGNYSALLTATNSHGNQGTAKVYFTVDNTPPMLNVEVAPGDVLPGRQLNVDAASDDAESVSADFGTQTTNMDYVNGAWNVIYAVPASTALGSYPVALAASDKIGNVRNVSVLYNVVDSISPITSIGGTGGSTSGGSQGGSIGGGANSGTSSGSQNGGSSTGGSSGSNSGGLSPGGGSNSPNNLPPGPDGPQQPDTPPGPDGPGDTPDDSFWDDILNFLNELWNLFLKILPFLLLAIGIIMVLGFFFPPVAALIFLICYIIGSLILDFLVPFLSALIFDIFSIPAIIFTSIGYATTALSPEFFGFSSIVLLMGSIIFAMLGFPILAGIFAILAFAFALIALYIFITDLLKGVDIFAFWKKLIS